MNDLWRRTWELLRRRPVLWMPLLCADLVTHTLRFLWPFLRNHLAASSLQTHTVLGGTVAGKAPVWLYPGLGMLRFMVEWANACIYIAAAIVTAKMVQGMCHRHGSVDKAKVPASVYAGNVVWVALQALLLSAAASVVVVFPVLYFLLHHQLRSLMMSPYVASTELLLVYLAVAYLMTPPMLRLITRSLGNATSSVAIAMGRNMALMVATCIVLLGLLEAVGKTPGVHVRADMLALGYVNSLIVALPYVPMFIAFGLLAMRGDAPMVEAPILERTDSGA